jgi:hypothetical protein
MGHIRVHSKITNVNLFVVFVCNLSDAGKIDDTPL